ncbi:MAG: hypothetical protein ACRD82_10930, partial [Blastocatellia bacterium]
CIRNKIAQILLSGWRAQNKQEMNYIMRMTQKKGLAVGVIWLLVVVAAVLVDAQSTADRALNIMRQAHRAIGGEQKIKEVKSFSLQAKHRQSGRHGFSVDGTVECLMLLPDKYSEVRVDNVSFGSKRSQRTRLTTLLDGEFWLDSRSSTSNSQVIGTPIMDDKAARAEEFKRLQTEFRYNLLAWLLTPPPGLSVEFSYVGEAEAEDGRADVIDVKGSDGFAARLFFDKKTHQLLMLGYNEAVEEMLVVMMRSGSKLEKEAKVEPKQVEVQWRFSDYRNVSGILLPHRMIQSKGNEVVAEWDVQEFKINPPLTNEDFNKKLKK